MTLNFKTEMFILSAGLIALAGCNPPSEKMVKSVATAPEVVAPEVKLAPPKTLPTAVNNPAVINFQGFGPAKFGGNEESLRMSWGRPLNASKSAKGSTCTYLNPETAPDQKRGIAFMFEDAKFVRYDVNDATQIAPGNFKVGDAASLVVTAFAGRVVEAPHKYVEGGRTLTVKPADKSEARLIFEIGKDSNITSWRMGIPPQVFYVEGCS